MALQFDPSPYLEAYRQRQAQRPDWNQMVNQPIQMGLQTLIQMQQQKRQKEMQDMQMGFAQQEQESKYGRQTYPSIGSMVNTALPTPRPSPFQSQQIPQGQGPDAGYQPRQMPQGMDMGAPQAQSSNLIDQHKSWKATRGMQSDFNYQPYGMTQEQGKQMFDFQPGFVPGSVGREDLFKYQKNLSEIDKNMREKKMESMVKNQFVGFQDGQPIIFDPSTKTFQRGSLPGSGTFTPKTEPYDIEKQVRDIDDQLSQIGTLRSMLSGEPSGMVGGAKSLLSRATFGGIGQMLKQYNDLKPAIATKIYRAATGDTRLSDQDAAARAYPLLPGGGEPLEVREAKLKNIEDILTQRKNNLTNGNNSPVRLNSPSSNNDPLGIR